MELFSRRLQRLEKSMKEVLKRTRFAFSDTIYGMEDVLDVLSDLTRIMEPVMKDSPQNPKYWANFDLFARSRVLLRSSYLCLITGNYGSALCLLRSVLENNELMLFFHLEPQEVHEWSTQPNWWKEKENKVGKLRDRIFSILAEESDKVRRVFDDLYGEMSEYTHPRFRGWKELKVKEGKIIKILRHPKYDQNTIESLLRKMIFITYQTFRAFEVTYNEYLPSNPSIHAKLEKAIVTLQTLFSRFQIAPQRM